MVDGNVNLFRTPYPKGDNSCVEITCPLGSLNSTMTTSQYVTLHAFKAPFAFKLDSAEFTAHALDNPAKFKLKLSDGNTTTPTVGINGATVSTGITFESATPLSVDVVRTVQFNQGATISVGVNNFATTTSVMDHGTLRLYVLPVH